MLARQDPRNCVESGCDSAGTSCKRLLYSEKSRLDEQTTDETKIQWKRKQPSERCQPELVSWAFWKFLQLLERGAQHQQRSRGRGTLSQPAAPCPRALQAAPPSVCDSGQGTSDIQKEQLARPRKDPWYLSALITIFSTWSFALVICSWLHYYPALTLPPRQALGGKAVAHLPLGQPHRSRCSQTRGDFAICTYTQQSQTR